MNTDSDILSLNETCLEDAYLGGSKFAGLVKAKKYIDTYRRRYHIDVDIPKTYAIPLSFHEQYKSSRTVSEDLVTQAMHCVAALGGNVAVRSSADIEDQSTDSCSGVFESVLNVKTREQMRNALNKVYTSAKTRPEAQMGIIIQQMIDEPLMAGVAYSETWYREPFVILNYTQGKTADKLIAHGGSEGKLFAVCKLIETRYSDGDDLSLRFLNQSDIRISFIPSIRSSRLLVSSEDDLKKYNKQFMLAAIVCGLERRLGYPIDMEFAFSKDGALHILQQRPYVFPEFRHQYINNEIETNYCPSHPIIAGKISRLSSSQDNDLILEDTDNGVIIYTKQSYKDIYSFTTGRSDGPLGAQYTHYGNMMREHLDFSCFIAWKSSQNNFSNIKEGDYLRINLMTGKWKSYSKKTPSFEIAQKIKDLTSIR